MSYKPNYPQSKIKTYATTPNASGRSPQDNLLLEESAQRNVAESEKWLIANKENPMSRSQVSTKEKLEEMGFTVLEDYDDLFYAVQPPTGWTKETQGYWTTIQDSAGKQRISQFFKGAFYDRDAFLNFN